MRISQLIAFIVVTTSCAIASCQPQAASIDQPIAIATETPKVPSAPEPVIRATVAEVLARPAQFEGKLLQVAGYSDPPQEHCCFLYESEADRNSSAAGRGLMFLLSWAYGEGSERFIFNRTDTMLPAVVLTYGKIEVRGRFRSVMPDLEWTQPGLELANVAFVPTPKGGVVH